MILRILTFLVLIAALAAVSLAQQSEVKPSKVMRFRGNVLAVEDSDRVKLAADDGNIYSALLIGIDSPDQDQDYFKKAKKRLADLVDDKDVTVILRSVEGGESYAVIYAGAEDVGLRLIQDGLAWFSPARSAALNSADREKYRAAEEAARTARLGLWAEKDAVSPWAFRGEKEPLSIDTALSPAQKADTGPAAPPRSQPVPGRTYILGPRGGCYYLNDQGIKVYVKDKTLCQKPQ